MSFYIPVGFYCMWCGAQRSNPKAVPEFRGDWQRLVNVHAPETCSVCRERWRRGDGKE